MALVLWILFSLVVCGLLAKRPHLTVLFAIGVWLAVPSVAGRLLVGTDLPFHPGMWTLGAAFLCLSFGDRRIILRGAERNLGTIAAFLAFIGYATLLTLTLRSEYATAGFINTFVSAFLAFVLVRSVLAADPDGVPRLVRGTLVFAIIETGLAIAQAATSNVLLFAAERAQFYWFNTTGMTSRATGTLDSPLDLAFFLVVCIPLTAQIKRPPLRFLLALFFVAGVALTQSRVGAGLAVAGLLYLVLRSGMTIVARLLITGTIGTVMTYLIFVPNALTAGLFDRFESATGSTLARSLASDLFFDRIWSQPVSGTGFGSSGIFRETGLLQTSLENAYLMVTWDFGVLAAVALGVVFVVAFIRGVFGRAARGTIAAFAFGLVAAGSYSGLATQSAALVVFLFVVGLAAPAARVARDSAVPDAEAAPSIERLRRDRAVPASA